MIEIEGYRLLKQIGAGGMGLVYEAEQLNPRRTVALKVLRGDFLGPRLARRLEFEAQVLGALKHSGIAQIHEAGWFKTEEGEQPFFAMEFVRGEPLIAYAAENKLSAASRVELLIKICEAVEHAHQRGVIHRDLKPANILVEQGGQPKVLDFGLARTVNSDLAALSTCRDLQEVVGTILYMSPEQTEGHSDQIDARSDVYALGAIGYELLTGELPHEHKHRNAFEYFCALKEEDPRPLGALNKAFRGDLELIFSKALMKEKSLRYASAGALGDDLRRHLANEPIMARPVSGIYQARKYARRNRALVAGTCATFLAMAAGMAGTMMQASRAAMKAKEAEIKTAETEKLRVSAEREQYLAIISLATLASSQQRFSEAEAALLKAPGHLRGWEWRHLWRLSHPELALLAGHEDGIRGVEYSPDGSRILSVSNDATGRIWDPKTGACVAILRGHEKRILKGNFSPRGGQIATASDDHTARIWSSDGKLEHVLAAHAGPVNRAIFSPDGARVLTASDDGTARLWNAATGECAANLEGHSAPVWEAEFDPAGRFVATASDDGTARLWDGTNGRPIAVMRGHSGEVNAVRFNPKSNLILTISEDGTARLWPCDEAWLGETSPILEPSPRRTIELLVEMPRWAEFEPGGERFIVAGRMGQAGRYLAETGEIFEGGMQINSEVEEVRIAPLKGGLAAVTKGNDALFFPLSKDGFHSKDPVLMRGHSHFVTSVAFHPGGSKFCTGSADGTVRVWPTAQARRAVREVQAAAPLVSASFSRNGELFLFDHKNGMGKTDPSLLESQFEPFLRVPGCDHADVRSDGSQAATVDEAGELTLWNLSGDSAERAANWNAGAVRSIKYSPDGAAILAAGPGGEVSLWNTADGTLVRKFQGHAGQASHGVFLPDGNQIVTAGDDLTARVWNAETAAEIHRLDLGSAPSSVSVSPDGTLFAIAGSDNSMTIWALDSSREPSRFNTEHRGGNLLCAFSPDGARLVTCTDDPYLKFWDTQDFSQVAALQKENGRIMAMSFSPDGRYLAVSRHAWRADIFDSGPEAGRKIPIREHGED